jgi:hypothetical protein
LAAGCSSDGSGAGDDAGSGSSPPDAAVLSSYVAALAERDVDAAMALRCREGRLEGDAKDLFGANLERLTDALGAPEVVRVSESDPPTGLAPWIEGAADDPEQRWRDELDGVELRYWLSFDGVEFDDPQIAVVLDEDGERRICGHATHAAERLFAALDDGIRDVGLSPVGALSELMPAAVGDAYQQVQDTPYPADVVPGALEGHTRAWQEIGAFGGVRVEAIRFSSPDVALAWAGHRARTVAGDAVQHFEVPGLPGAVGVRGSAWSSLLIQPTGEPPFLDRVFFVAGDVGVEVNVTQSDADCGTREAAGISTQVADLAR